MPRALCFKHSMGSNNVGPRNRAKEESELTHTHLSFKLWLWLVCFFIVFCGIASGSVLQTQHGVTMWGQPQCWTFLFFYCLLWHCLWLCASNTAWGHKCWAEEQSQRRVWIKTYPSILQTLTLTFLFFYCLLWHCLGLFASNTAWGYIVGLRNRAKEESELTHNHLSFKLWLWLFFFFYCLLWHCLGLCASNTAWGHTMLGRGTEPKKSLN